jgi:hypothetical protein
MTYTQDPKSSYRSKTGTLYMQAVCPSCHELTGFRFLGQQKWPERVAEILGKPLSVTLWRCGHCETTVSIEDS